MSDFKSTLLAYPYAPFLQVFVKKKERKSAKNVFRLCVDKLLTWVSGLPRSTATSIHPFVQYAKVTLLEISPCQGPTVKRSGVAYSCSYALLVSINQSINPRPLATVAAGVLPFFAWRVTWRSCGVEGTRRSWCASLSRSFRSNYRQRSDCRACWICGRSVLGVCIYDAVPELCRPVDIWHGSRTLRYGLWRSWGRSAWSTGWGDSFFVFFSFIFLSPNAPRCLSVSASSFLIDAGTSAWPASGNWAHSWCCLSEGKLYKKLAEWNVKRCAWNNELVLCKFSIYQHCKLIMKKLKKIPTQR